MSDLKTALEKALLAKEIDDWETEENQRMPNAKPVTKPATTTGTTMTNTANNPSTPHQFRVSNNVMRATFDHIKANPGKTTPEYADELAKLGYKSSSTVSVMSQLVRAKQVRKDEQRRLFVAQSEYTPIHIKRVNGSKIVAPAPAAAKRRVVVMKRSKQAVGNTHQSSGIATLPTQLIAHNNPAWSAQSLVATLSVVQARELYDELKRIFGGAL